MKQIILALILFGGISVEAQEIVVRSDKRSDQDFSKYKTYYWASQVDQELDDNFYFLDNLLLKADVRDAVRVELGNLGYRINRNNPDLLVNFRVFNEPTTLRGVEGYGTKYWTNREYQSASDTRTFEVEAGTLIISLLDRREGTLVWQGLGSGLTSNGEFITDEGKIREAVNLILADYGYLASEYTKR